MRFSYEGIQNIHQLAIPLILEGSWGWGGGGVPGDTGQGVGYSLDRAPVGHRAGVSTLKFTPTGNQESPFNLTLSLDCGRKLENLEGTHPGGNWVSNTEPSSIEADFKPKPLKFDWILSAVKVV